MGEHYREMLFRRPPCALQQKGVPESGGSQETSHVTSFQQKKRSSENAEVVRGDCLGMCSASHFRDAEHENDLILLFPRRRVWDYSRSADL